MELPTNNAGSSSRPLILTGSTLALGDYKVLDLLESAGASVVIEEFAEGIRHYWEQVEVGGDLMEALADRYFRKRVPPAWFRPSRERMDFVIKLARDFKVDGVVWYSLMYRESYDIEGYLFRRALEKFNIPMLKINSGYDTSETASLRIRIETFIETIKGGKNYVF